MRNNLPCREQSLGDHADRFLPGGPFQAHSRRGQDLPEHRASVFHNCLERFRYSRILSAQNPFCYPLHHHTVATRSHQDLFISFGKRAVGWIKRSAASSRHRRDSGRVGSTLLKKYERHQEKDSYFFKKMWSVSLSLLFTELLRIIKIGCSRSRVLLAFRGIVGGGRQSLGYGVAHIEFGSQNPSEKRRRSEPLEPNEKVHLLGLRDAICR